MRFVRADPIGGGYVICDPEVPGIVGRGATLAEAMRDLRITSTSRSTQVSMTRPGWDQWALSIAAAVATRADCTRRQVGAVVLTPDHHILSTGYNGAPSGEPGCLTDGACPRGQQPVERECKECGGYGTVWRGEEPISFQVLCRPCDGVGKIGIAPGSSYDTGAGSCIAVHAEVNALLRADVTRRQGGTLAITDEPCDGCRRVIAASGVARVVWPGGDYAV